MPNLYKSNYNLNNNLSKVYTESRGEDSKNKKKLSVKQMGKNAKCSLNDVGQFLCNFKRFSWYIKFYKLFK